MVQDAQSRGGNAVIATRFDTRNGTDRFQKLMERTRALEQDVVPFPIEAPGPQ